MNGNLTYDLMPHDRIALNMLYNETDPLTSLDRAIEPQSAGPRSRA
ncbi:MAG: hypothetical protein Q7T44_18040 [Parvibaculum sp.]|nr:hypothetical protein [Parvibaculum sp.]